MSILNQNAGEFPLSTPLDERMAWVREYMALNHIEQHVIFSNLSVIYTDTIDTAATNGKVCLVNPHYAMSLNPFELHGLCWHESDHVLNKHHLRGGAYPHDIFNKGADYGVNLRATLDKVTLPQGALLDYQYRGWATEAVCDHLMRKQEEDDRAENAEQPEPPEDGSGEPEGAGEGDDASDDNNPEPHTPDGCSDTTSEEEDDGGGENAEVPETNDNESGDEQAEASGSGEGEGEEAGEGEEGQANIPAEALTGNGAAGGVFQLTDDDGQPLSEDQLQEEEAKLNVQIIEAAMAAAAAGQLSAGTKRLVEEMCESKPDWRDATRDFLVDQAKPSNPTFQRSNRSRQVRGLIMPGWAKEDMGKIVVLFDQSSSMSDIAVAAFFPHLRAIGDETEPEQIVVVPFTASEIDQEKIKRYEPGDEIVAERGLYGGTDLRPSFEWLLDEDNVAGVIVFSDMQFNWNFNDLQPECPVLWCSTDTDLNSMWNKAIAPEWGDLVIVTE